MRRVEWGWILFGALGVAAAAFSIFTLSNEQLLVGAASIATLIVLWRLDGWQRIYASLLALLVLAASPIPELADYGYYPRFAALFLLALWTWAWKPQRKVALKDLPRPTSTLVQGLWWCWIVAAASTVWSVDPAETAAQAAALFALVAIVHGLVTRRWTENGKAAADLAVAFGVMTAAITVGAAAYFLGVLAAVNFSGTMRGLFNNPNLLSLVAALTAGLGWALYRHTGRKLYLPAVGMAIAALVLSGSRTALIALAAAAALLLLLRSGISAIAKSLYLGAFAVGAYLVGESMGVLPALDLAGLVEGLLSEEGGSVLNGREVVWEAAIREWKQAPIAGVGYGAGPSLIDVLLSTGALRFSSPSAHNSYLQWLLEVGVVGAIPLLFVLAAVLQALLRSNRGGLAAGLRWAVAAGLLIQVTESPMFGTGQPYPYLFWPAVAALTLAVPKPVEQQRHLGKKKPRYRTAARRF